MQIPEMLKTQFEAILQLVDGRVSPTVDLEFDESESEWVLFIPRWSTEVRVSQKPQLGSWAGSIYFGEDATQLVTLMPLQKGQDLPSYATDHIPLQQLPLELAKLIISQQAEEVLRELAYAEMEREADLANPA